MTSTTESIDRVLETPPSRLPTTLAQHDTPDPASTVAPTGPSAKPLTLPGPSSTALPPPRSIITGKVFFNNKQRQMLKRMERSTLDVLRYMRELGTSVG